MGDGFNMARRLPIYGYSNGGPHQDNDVSHTTGEDDASSLAQLEDPAQVGNQSNPTSNYIPVVRDCDII